MKFRKIKSFDAPEGDHHVVCEQVFEKPDGDLKLNFRSLSAEDPIDEFWLGKNFKSGTDELVRFLLKWLPRDTVAEILSPSFDPQKLIGLEAVVRAVHIRNTSSGHHKPFVYVADIMPIEDSDLFRDAA